MQRGYRFCKVLIRALSFFTARMLVRIVSERTTSCALISALLANRSASLFSALCFWSKRSNPGESKFSKEEASRLLSPPSPPLPPLGYACPEPALIVRLADMSAPGACTARLSPALSTLEIRCAILKWKLKLERKIRLFIYRRMV